MNADKKSERDELARQILDQAPRLSRQDRLTFVCHPGLECFNLCCGNVNIVLGPLDILRMSRRLGISTTDFLAQYTLVPFTGEQKLPFVFLKMNPDEKKSCPFVTASGCSIYPDRPWPCRMYPLGQASPGDPGAQGEGFFFLMHEEHCQGHAQERSWTIAEWLADQGVGEYEQIGELFKKVLLHPYLERTPLDPARMEMFYMACYDLDKFRRFVFESNFLHRFLIEPPEQERLRSDDMELLKFAFRWLGFALFGELTIPLNQELLSEREREMLRTRIKP